MVAGRGEFSSSLTVWFGSPERWSVLTAVTALVAAAGLVVADAQPAAAAPVTYASSGLVSMDRGPAPVGEPWAPDAVSAMMGARAQGVPIEDMSARTVDSSTWALPDGTWHTGIGAGVVWVPTGEGYGTDPADWARVNLTLEAGEDGVVRPRSQLARLALSGGPDAPVETAATDAIVDGTVLASVTDPETGVEVVSAWPGELPVPVLEGRRATYVQVLPGVDLVVEATNTGFEEFFVLADQDAAAALSGLELGLSAEGGQVQAAESAESIEVLDASSGEALGQAGPALWWDAAADEVREFPITAQRPEEEPVTGVFPASVADWDGADQTGEESGREVGSIAQQQDEIALEVTAEVVDRTVEVDAAGDAVVTLDLTEGLEDAVFPVVVDPSVAVSVGFDTFVQTGNTYDASTSTDLRLGSFDGSTVARSFLSFPTASLAGKLVSAASLSLWEYHSSSCTASKWEAWRTGAASTSTRWTAQPTWVAEVGSSTATLGYSSACPGGRVNIPVTAGVQYAANNSLSTLWLGLRADNEASSLSWKRFYSNDYGSKLPVMSVTYNSFPNKPAGASHAAGQYTWWPNSTDPNRVLYVTTAKPSFSAIVTDPDGGSVRSRFVVKHGATVVWNMVTGAAVASGGRSTFTPTSTTPALVNGNTYGITAYAFDDAVTSAAGATWSFVVDTSAPAAPTVTANNFTNGGWAPTTPSSNTFTFTSSNTDVVTFKYSLDGGAWTPRTANGTGSTRTATISWAPAGAHQLRVQAVDKAGWTSAISTFTFGSGAASLSSPVAGARSTDTFTVAAAGPSASSGTVTPRLYWRPAGTANATGWDPANGSASGWTLATTLPAIASGSPVKVNTLFSAAAAATTMGAERVPALIDVQVCFTYSSTGTARCTWVGTSATDKSHISVLRVPHAFGDSFPEAEAGPGRVALWTGEFTTASTDVSIATPVDTLSISRTYTTFGGPASNTAAGVFGPGWVANLDGSDWGSAGYTVYDSTGVDGTIALVDGDGAAYVWRQPGGGKTWWLSGTYVPVDEETAELGARLVLSGTGTTRTLTLTDADSSVTVWSPGKTLVTNTPTEFIPVSITQAGQVGSTTFSHDSNGRITRILAPVPAGVSCSTALVAGCRALNLTYTGTGTATRLSEVSYTAWDEYKSGGAGMNTIPVATYAYSGGYLTAVTDPRTSLTTTYTYNAPPAGLYAPQLATVKDPGLATWRLAYGTTPQGPDGLLRVSRDPATGTGSALVQSSYIYGINPATATTGLPDMTAAGVGVWEQSKAPTWGAAVFGPDHPVSSAAPASISAADWPYADLQYTDAEGRVTNSGSYGAGAWQLDATTYDSAGRVIQTLTPSAIEQIRTIVADGGSVDVASYATITRYNADILAPTAITWANGTIAAGSVLTPAGTYVTDVWSPAAPAGPDGDLVRTRTHTDYDQGAPGSGVNPATGVPYRLATTTTVYQAQPDSGSSDPTMPIATGEPVLSQTLTGYNPIDGSSATDATSGWTLGVPTSTTTPMGGSTPDLVTSRTVYNAGGQAIQTLQPASSGTDAGTWNTVYYTAAANPTDPQCGGKPALAGWICLIRTAETTASIASTHTAGFNIYGQPAVVNETLAGATRTTTTTYDAAGRVHITAVTATGLSGTQPLPTTKNEYSPSTGAQTALVSLNGTTETGRISTGYDSWGRTISYTDTDSGVTTTTYNTAGQVATITDPTGTITYTYDGTDAAGQAEYRGLPTGMTVTNTTGPLTLGAAYDAAGNVTLETFPGNLQRLTSYDQAGQETGLAYTGNGPSGRLELFAFTLTRDAEGNIIGDTSPTNTRTFTNDNADRLIAVTDTDTLTSTCTVRTYGFDANGNRTNAGTATGDPEAACPSAPSSVRTWTYDDADRVQTGANTTGSYVYDNLGRQTTIPAIDTPAGANAGDLTLGYYLNDLAHTITQNGTTTTYTLDPALRRSVATTNDGTTTTTLERHYTDTTDNPAWATSNDGTTTTTTRYTGGLASGLGLVITNNVASLAVADHNSAIRTNIEIPITGDGGVAGAWSTTDEFGNNLAIDSPDTGAIDYAWHGQDERALVINGLTLMGVRLYNATTGQFTTRDPIFGGNATSYTYPADPINESDLTGEARKRLRWHFFGHRVRIEFGRIPKRSSVRAGYWRGRPEFRYHVNVQRRGGRSRHLVLRPGQAGRFVYLDLIADVTWRSICRGPFASQFPQCGGSRNPGNVA